MSYHLIKSIKNDSFTSQLPSQKELIEKINSQTRSTKKLVSLLLLQKDPISNYKKGDKNGKTI